MGLLPPLDIPRPKGAASPLTPKACTTWELFHNPSTQPACASRPQPAAKPRPFPLYIQRPKGASFPFEPFEPARHWRAEPSAPGPRSGPNKKAPSFESAFY